MNRPARGDIEAILPLTPMQEALLFGTLAARAAGEDPGFLQLHCTLRGALDEARFRQAWELTVARHAALRTSVHWQEAERPLQVVARTVAAPWAVEDWRTLPADTHAKKLEAFLAADRARGLALDRAPAMRFVLLRFSDDEWRLVWSCHHVLLDGWSGALVLGDLAAAFEALHAGREPRLPPARPYRDFVGWLQGRDATETESFWRRELAGLRAPTPLPFDASPDGAAGPTPRRASVRADLGARATAALQAFARHHRLTAGTAIQGAWALVLAAHAAEDEVCFGATVSGRAAPLPGIEGIAGVFNNALPVRTAVVRAASPAAFLTSLQEHVATLQRHAHVSPADLQAWSALPGTRRLFDSLVVFENFPADILGASDDRQLRWGDLRGVITSSHALVLVAAPGERLALTLLHDPQRVDGPDARRILDELRTVLARLPEQTGADIGTLIPASGRPPGDGAAASARRHAVSPDALAPPVNGTELRLWKIWERVLGTHDFGVEDDFFLLGGHSLLVARVLAEIEAQLGVRVPVATLLREPTVRVAAREVDRLIESGAARTGNGQGSVLVPLAPGTGDDDARPPFFFLHSLAGDVVVSYKLIRHFAAHQRVFGVEADPRGPPAARIEDMAALYAREIRTLQPRGPYCLGGYCFGGTLAFETARQLAGQGAEIARLVVIDSDPRWPRWPRNTRLLKAIYDLQMTPRGQRLRVIVRKGRKALAMLASAVRAPRAAPADVADGAHVRHDPAYLAAYERYVPGRFPGRITVIVAGDDPPGLVRWRRAQWAALADGGIDVHTVPGTHFTLIDEPNVRVLVDRVQACLDDVTTAPSTAALPSG